MSDQQRRQAEQLTVERFAHLMALRLKENREKGHWNRYTKDELIRLLSEEFNELIQEICVYSPDEQRIDHEASDLACICAFISYNYGNLFSAKPYSASSHE
jgi:hypothetical protein